MIVTSRMIVSVFDCSCSMRFCCLMCLRGDPCAVMESWWCSVRWPVFCMWCVWWRSMVWLKWCLKGSGNEVFDPISDMDMNLLHIWWTPSNAYPQEGQLWGVLVYLRGCQEFPSRLDHWQPRPYHLFNPITVDHHPPRRWSECHTSFKPCDRPADPKMFSRELLMKHRVDAGCDIVVIFRFAWEVAGVMVGVDELMFLGGVGVIEGVELNHFM